MSRVETLGYPEREAPSTVGTTSGAGTREARGSPRGPRRIVAGGRAGPPGVGQAPCATVNAPQPVHSMCQPWFGSESCVAPIGRFVQRCSTVSEPLVMQNGSAW